VRYLACSNFSGWHLMKSLAIAEKYGWSRYVAHQAYYSLVGREYEWELMPLALDQKVGTIVWSPLAAGRLTGKFRRNQEVPTDTRIKLGGGEGPAVETEEWFFKLIDVMDEISAATGKTLTQIALNWLLQRPTVATVIIGARNEEQLRQNLGAVGWSLTPEQVASLDAASEREPIYPYWHQRGFVERNPLPTPSYR
jgi:aryl-alcohol dehydrogenase-like predicted oxidoreductase